MKRRLQYQNLTSASDVWEIGKEFLAELKAKKGKAPSVVRSEALTFAEDSLKAVPIARYNARDVAMSAHAFGSLSIVSPRYFERLAHAVDHVAPDFKQPYFIATTLWGFARAHRAEADGGAAKSVSAVLSGRLKDDNVISAFRWQPQDVSNILWALAIVKHRDDEVVNNIAARSLKIDLRDRFEPQAATNSLWACAVLAVCNAEFNELLAGSLVRRFAGTPTHQRYLGTGMWAAAKVGDTHAFSALQALARTFEPFTVMVAENFLHSLATLVGRQPGFVEDTARGFVVALCTFVAKNIADRKVDPRTLSTLLWSVVQLSMTDHPVFYASLQRLSCEPSMTASLIREPGSLAMACRAIGQAIRWYYEEPLVQWTAATGRDVLPTPPPQDADRPGNGAARAHQKKVVSVDKRWVVRLLGGDGGGGGAGVDTRGKAEASASATETKLLRFLTGGERATAGNGSVRARRNPAPAREDEVKPVNSRAAHVPFESMPASGFPPLEVGGDLRGDPAAALRLMVRLLDQVAGGLSDWATPGPGLAQLAPRDAATVLWGVAAARSARAGFLRESLECFGRAKVVSQLSDKERCAVLSGLSRLATGGAAVALVRLAGGAPNPVVFPTAVHAFHTLRVQPDPEWLAASLEAVAAPAVFAGLNAIDACNIAHGTAALRVSASAVSPFFDALHHRLQADRPFSRSVTPEGLNALHYSFAYLRRSLPAGLVAPAWRNRKK
ncbi:hypothetical protein DIPPA_15368 [Diplonema papillatum]|nr:hypothetical protein DIPPA_15368 [Diplonema papillatum]